MKQDSHKTTKRFDPLLFNGLGSERERKWNNIVNVIMYDISIIIGVISFVFFNVFVIQKSNNNIWIFLYIIYIITFIIYCILWFYLKDKNALTTYLLNTLSMLDSTISTIATNAAPMYIKIIIYF
ncbi:hypothetical protein CCZ01_06955 [Helicobacter monodelphidis]|nr:hypothetical protein CCZ01_06955 [Helicobacter sp. 15-1451]